jgi:hypothetical protein
MNCNMLNSSNDIFENHLTCMLFMTVAPKLNITAPAPSAGVAVVLAVLERPYWQMASDQQDRASMPGLGGGPG